MVLGEEQRRAARRERRCLDGEDVLVIQTKATRLNAAVYGQALLSPELIRTRWTPRRIRSVLLCTADDPELRPYVEAIGGIEVHLVEPRRDRGFWLARVPGAVTPVAERLGGCAVAPAQLSSRLRIDGVVIPDVLEAEGRPLPDLIADRKVVAVHSTPGAPCMYLAGGVVLAAAILRTMGVSSVHSAIVRGRRDRAIEAALRRFVEVEFQPLTGTTTDQNTPAAPRSAHR